MILLSDANSPLAFQNVSEWKLLVKMMAISYQVSILAVVLN